MADRKPVIEVHQGDLPAGIGFGPSVAVDTETTGLHPHRDRLCLVQLSAGDGTCHLVRIDNAAEAVNLRALLADPGVTKIFHYARFDLMMIRRHLGVVCRPVFCTRIASRLVRTYTQSHGLKDVCKELLGVELSKEQQSSDWAAGELSAAQVVYAANDVLHLHGVKARLEEMLNREGRVHLAQACFDFLNTRAELDLGGWVDEDIFSHS